MKGKKLPLLSRVPLSQRIGAWHRRCLVPMIIFCLVSAKLFAAGSTTGETLIQSVSARAQGMGEAYTAIPAEEGGVLTYHYNPAAIGFSKSMESAFTFKRGTADDNFAIITLGTPTSWGKIAGTFLYYSVGTIDLITTAGATKSVKAQKDLGTILSYSTTLWENLAWGINGKFLRSELIESFTANAFAADLGAQYKIKNVVLGAAVQNLGTNIKYNKTSDPIPLTFRSGFSYRKEWYKDYRALAAFDLVKRRGEDAKASLGLEYTVNGSVLPHQSELTLRSGYIVGQDNGKISFGLGLKIDQYRTDYAMQLMDSNASSHLVTFGFLFGSH